MSREPTSHAGGRQRTDQHPGRATRPPAAGSGPDRWPGRGPTDGRVGAQPVAELIGTFFASAVTASPSGSGRTSRTASWNGSSGSGTLTEMLLA